MDKVAIYHFTDKSEKRPIVNEKQMNILRKFANRFGNIEKEYLDMSLRKCDQVEKEKMINEIGNYNTLVTKDFYHISKNTGTCISLLKEFLEKGVETHSMEDGCFIFEEIPFHEPLKVVLYHSKYVEEENNPNNKKIKRGNSVTVETQLNILKLFISSKTNWTIVDEYIDVSEGQTDDKQIELMQLIKNSEKYDLLVCKDFNTVHWRTSKFCKRRHDMQLGIFSLKEGYLRYGKD